MKNRKYFGKVRKRITLYKKKDGKAANACSFHCQCPGRHRLASAMPVFTRTANGRSLPEHQTQIRRCSQARSIRQNVPKAGLTA